MASSKSRGRPPHDDLLTPTEWQIVHAVQHGMTNQQIAVRRGVSIDAIKYHVKNILAKTGLANKAALRGWFRAPADSALSHQEAVMSELNIGHIGQISRSVSDIKAAENWYGRVLGLPHLFTFGNLAFFDCGGTRLFLEEHDQVSSEESVLYFQVPDIEAAHQELMDRGVEFTSTPHLIHKHDNGIEEWMAFFNDPDGRTLALICQISD